MPNVNPVNDKGGAGSNKSRARFGRRLSFVLFALLGLPAVVGSGALAAAPPSAPLVVATVGMIGDVAAEIAADCANVETLLGPGSDPHLYRASAGDVRRLGNADLVLYGGLHLEAGLASVLDRFQARTPTAAVSELGVPEQRRIAATGALAAAGRAAGAANAAGVVYDPHVWMDVSLWSDAAAVIGTELETLMAGGSPCASTIAANTKSYRARLAALHAWAGEAILSIPERQRILITAHDAFAYFGQAYGIDVEGIQGISTETEAAVADIRRVADIVIERQVPAVFIESTINPRTIRAVKEAVEQRGGGVGIGEQLYADALGSSGTADGTYIGMMIHNVTAIASALGGDVPPLPEALAAW